MKSSGLMVRTLDRLYRVDPGFDAAGLLAVELTISDSRYPERSQYLAFYREAMERFAGIPGVVEVGSIRRLPLRGRGEELSYTVPDRPQPPRGGEPSAESLQVSPGALRTLGVPLLDGRALDANDRNPESPVALANQAFAREAFGARARSAARFRSATRRSRWWDWSATCGRRRSTSRRAPRSTSPRS